MKIKILFLLLAISFIPRFAFGSVTVRDCDNLARSINLKYCAEQSNNPASRGWYNREAWTRASHTASQLLSQSPTSNQATFLQDIINVSGLDPEDGDFDREVRETYDDYLKL